MNWGVSITMFLLLCPSILHAAAVEKQKPHPSLTGHVILPDEPGYGEARLVSNFYSSKDKYPDLIVYCKNEQDVQHAVAWVRFHEKSIRIRSGGHNHEAFSTGNGVVIIDVSEMKQLHIDKTQGIATVQPGITGGELYRKLYEVGLTQVGGTCSEVGLSGLVLSGGMGPLLRRHGLACDNLLALEMINANGDKIIATATNENKDLFWACQGGGAGNFGVITAMQIKVYPATPVVWFNLGWDWNDSVEKVLATWQDFFSKPDSRFFSHLDLWSRPFPSEKFNKQPFKVLGVFWGTPEEAKMELEPFLQQIGKTKEETIELVNWNRAIQLFEEATSVFITDKPEYKSTGAFVMKPFSNEAIQTIGETLRTTQAPLFNVLLFTMGGAVQEVAPTATAYFYREAPFFISYSIQWLKSTDDVAQTQEVDQLRQKLLPYAYGDYIGNPDRNLNDYLTDYYGENVRRLRCVKSQYDPENVFHYEQSIPPAPVVGLP